MKYNASMFQSIKDALNKNDKGASSGLYTEIMKTVPGNTYTVRLLPNSKDPSKTFFHYYQHGWDSFATGEFVQATSPQTFGERDPISEERFRVLRTGTDEDKEKWGLVRRSEKWLVNVYVIEDPTNPENNGKVKILRYGKQVQKIIMEAIEGEEAEEFGPKIFDLGPEGVNFKIKVEEQGDFPTYVASRFTATGKLKLTEAEQEAIYKGTHPLEELVTVKSYDELKQMINEHIYVDITRGEKQENTPAKVTKASKTTKPPVESEEVPSHDPATDVNVEDEINNLLKDL